MADSTVLLILGAVAFALAGFVKGVIGLGLPTVVIGLLSLVMSPAQAAALLVVPVLVTNTWQMFAGSGFVPLLRRLWPMLLGVCVGTWAGSGLISTSANGAPAIVLGVALMLYAGVSLASVQFHVPPRAEIWLSPIIGAVTGVVTAATGVFVMPGVPYVQALALDKEDLVQALGISFTVSTVALAVALASVGIFRASVAGMSLIALAPALLGMMVGQWVRQRVRPEVFRLCFFLGLLALGAHLALRIFY